MIARKGRVRAHHFAHKQGESGSLTDCQETALHNAAKRLLAYHLDSISVPPLTIQRPTKQFFLPTPKTVKFKKQLLLQGANLSLDEGDIEPRLEAGSAQRPDAYAHSALLGKVYFEVYVTHPVPEEKKAAYQALGLWVLEIDLSECDPSQVGLDRLKELLERDAARHWLSWNLPGDVRESLNEYETTVAELQENQELAYHDDLQKPIPKAWVSPEGVLLKALRYQQHEYPVNKWIPAPTITLAQGYWVTESIGGMRLPVFWEPYKEAVADLDRKYQRKRERALSYVLASANGTAIDLGEQTRLVAVMQWVLQAMAIEPPSPVHHIMGLERQPNSGYEHGSTPMFIEKWHPLWADPALNDDELEIEGCVSADIPEAFARACILWGAARMIILADGKAFADRHSLASVGRIQDYGDVYTAIRLRCESLSPLPCRLILEEGGFSRSLNITRHLRVRDGKIYLQAMGTDIPTSLTPPDRKESFPIYLVPGLSYSDESALFKANESRLTDFLNDRLQPNRDTMSQYAQGDSLLSSFVAFFQQRSDGI